MIMVVMIKMIMWIKYLNLSYENAVYLYIWGGYLIVFYTNMNLKTSANLLKSVIDMHTRK